MAADTEAPRGRWKSRWASIKRWLLPIFFLLVIGLLIHQGQRVDWAAVGRGVRAMPWETLLLAGAFSLGSHALYGSFDLLGRRHVRLPIGAFATWCVACISYAFNLALGSVVGAVGVRYRLYGHLGARPGLIARVLGLGLITNWLGYAVLAGIIFAGGFIKLPPRVADLSDLSLRLIGVGLLVASAVWVGACLFATKRDWKVRGHVVRLPTGSIAVAQVLLSVAHWGLMAAVIHALLLGKVDYPSVLGTLLVASIAALITHVPAGLGVLEGIFVALLAHRVPPASILAAVLAYRVIYQLAPVALTGLIWLVLERRPAVAVDPADSKPAEDGAPA